MRSLSIFGKLLVYQSIPILLTVLFLGWLVYDHMRDALLQQQRDEAALFTHHMMDAVEDRSRTVERLVSGIVHAPAFQSFDSRQDVSLLKAEFERHAAMLPRIAVVDARHHEVYVYEHGRDLPPARNLAADPLLQEAFFHRNRVRWGTADGSADGEPALRLALVHTDSSGDFLGALHATVAIDAMLGDVVERVAGSDSNGAVFLASGQPVLTSSHMPQAEVAAIGRWLADRNASGEPAPAADTFARLTADEVDIYASFAAAAARPWVAVVSTPYADFIAPSNTLLRRIAIIAGLVLLAATGLAWVAAERMARPLMQLGAAARRLAAGDYDAVVPVRSDDEFGMLARSFNEMSRSLRKAHGDLAREIEERRRTEGRLETTEAQFRAVFDNSPICLNLKDIEGRYLLVNRQDEEWLGLPSSAVLGRTADEFMEPDREDLHGLRALEAEVLRTGKPAQREIEVHRDGGVYHRLLIKFPVTGDTGKVLRIGTAAVDITERKHAEAAIRRNEMRFRSAVENLAIGFAYFDADDRLVAANAEWLRHYELGDVEPETLRYEDLLRRMVESGMLDLAIGDADREAWIRDRVDTHRNPSGEPLLRHYTDGTWALLRENRTPDGGIIQTRTDITALRQAEQKLADSEARFKALFDNLPIGLIVKDPEQRIVMMNPNFERRWQRRAEDYLGKPYSSLFPEEGDGRADAEEELAAFADGRPLIVERQRRTPDGRLRTILIHKFPIYGDDGALAAIGSAGVDLTELRLAQQEASQAERLLYEAVESLPLAFALFDADDRLVLANEYVERDTAWNPDLIAPGVTYEALLRDCVARGEPLNAAEDPEGWVAERLERHRSGAGGTENRLPDGRVMHAISRKTSNGGTITLRHDITDRKRAEEALKRHLEQLEELVDERTRHLVQEVAERRQAEASLRELNETLEDRVALRTQQLQMEKVRAELANRAKTDFLQHMSHELRTPLNAVIGFSDMIRQQIMGPVGHEIYLGYARDIYESGSYLLSLINDILDIARIEEGVLEVDDEVLDLAALVAACCKVVEGRAHEKRLSLETKLSSGAPGLLAEERRIKQILINLLFNAIKFTPEGGRVCLSVEPMADGSLALVVADTGIGIAPEDQERVMEPFGRVENSLSTSAQGTGLGLPICRALVEAHGGRLELESVVGEGTTVRAVFPPERMVAEATAAARGHH